MIEITHDLPKRIDNVCDICLGKKVKLNGDPCVCGDGSLYGLLTYFRTRILELENDLERAECRIEELNCCYD